MGNLKALGFLLGLLVFSTAAGAVAETSGEASFLIGRSYVDSFLLEDQTSFGGTVGAYSTLLGFELAIDYMPVSDFEVPGVDFGASFLNIMGNVVVQLPLGSLRPYATVGYGALIADASEEFAEFEFLGTFGALNYGFGGKLFFTERLGVRVDYRRFAVQAGDDEAKLRIPLTNFRIESSPDFDRLMFGVAVRW